jgi:hypothetical protein
MATGSEPQGRGPALRPLPPSDPGIARPSEPQAMALPGRTIALQVIPFSE